MSDIQADQVLDCKGLSCPLPVVKTKKTIDGMQAGQVLLMHATDPGSANDMTAWAKRTGNEIMKVDQGGGVWSFYIKKLK